MECRVVFAHELVQLHVLLVLPPLLPLIDVVCCDGDVANWSVKPHVKDLVLEFVDRDRRAPFKVSRDHSFNQTVFKELLCESP